MKNKTNEYVECKNCGYCFSTEDPNFKLTPCPCGRINVDTNEFSARVIGEPEDYNFSRSSTEDLKRFVDKIHAHFKHTLN